MARPAACLALLLAAAWVCGSEGLTCGSNEFACQSGDECYPEEYLCDDFPDCEDRSDEEPLYDCTAYLAGDAQEEAEEVPVIGGGVSPEESSEEEEKEVVVTPLGPPEQCALRKCEVGGKFKLADGQTLYYSYEAKTVTQLSGSSPSNTSLAIRATLAFSVLTACEIELKVQDVVVVTTRSDSGGILEEVENNAFVSAVTKNPLRFSYHDGLVEELCPALDEDPNALNFKRAAVSLLQNTMPRLDLDHRTTERDVVGDCKVEYQVEGVDGKSLLLKKTRDIPSCTTRSATTSFIKGVEYDFVGVRSSRVEDGVSFELLYELVL